MSTLAQKRWSSKQSGQSPPSSLVFFPRKKRTIQRAKGLEDSLGDTRRPLSAYLDPLPDMPRFLRWETLVLPQKVKHRLDMMSQSMPHRHKNGFLSTRKEWRASLALYRRQTKDLRIKLQAHYQILSGIQLFRERTIVGSALKTLGKNMLAMILDVIMAIIYTAGTNVFLASFCQHRLPLVRNWACSSWDELQRHRHQNQSVAGLNDPLDNILHSGDKSMSFKLPHQIAHYSSRARSLRARLPATHYPASDQKYFQGKLTEFIDLTMPTISNAQFFHAHMVGTIKYHVSNGNYVIQTIDDGKPLAGTSVSDNSLLVRGMAWLDSWYMIYLPVGIEPIQETSLQVYKAQTFGNQLMRDHLTTMARRIQQDIQLIVSLQSKLFALGSVAYEMEHHVSKVVENNEKDESNRGNKVLLWLKNIFHRQSYEDQQIDRRNTWLGIMGPEFGEVGEFLIKASAQLGDAHVACSGLIEQLEWEEVAASYGQDTSDFILKQSHQLSLGLEGIEKQLTSFDSEYMRFDSRQFIPNTCAGGVFDSPVHVYETLPS
ncbi:hypothetical protein G7Y79_00031g065960 [Physcia stellaris]|nr:hypothetical protein G7Y79_00031g065960 [Physcia stellaris]